MAEKNKSKLTPFEQEQAEVAKQILSYKLSAESNIVSILYKNPDEFYNIDLELDDFNNNVWRVYFEIAHDLVVKEQKNVLDDVVIGIYLEKHSKLRKKYEEYGGYNTILRVMEQVKEDNLYAYIVELRKWQAVLRMIKHGYPIKDNLSKYTDMTQEEIYNDFEINLNHIFMNKSESAKSYNIFENMHEFINELNENSEVGMPFHNAELLTDATGGFNLNGHIYGLGAGSGCVDCDTEFFNGSKWKRIADYTKGDKVLQYNKDGTAELVYPIAYIKNKSDYLWHFKTKYGLDQCLSDEHTVVYKSSKTGCGNEGRMNKIKFKELMRRHNTFIKGFSGRFYTSFDYSGNGIDLSDDEIRLMIATFADGHFFKDKYLDNPTYCRFHIKKDRKKERLLYLAKLTGRYSKVVTSAADGYHDIYINVPFRAKSFPKDWYNCNKHQLKVIADEVMFWDGCYEKNNRYSTTIKSDADFVQFVFSALGYRAAINTSDRSGEKYFTCGKEYVRKSVEYSVSYTKRNMVGMSSNQNKAKINKYKTLDGFEYCFTVPSHMLVLRRNDRIFITGNCGKSTMAFNYLLPSALKSRQEMVFIINEEDEKKFKKELIVWVANNVFKNKKEKLQKRTIRDGNFNKETLDLLRECADWIEERKDENILTVIPLERYSVNTVVKIIKKYSTAFGTKIFVLDTLKESFDAKTDEIYKSMMRDMITLYDVVKPSAKNVGLLVTYQLGKGSVKMRHLTNNEIGQAKSILDVMSVNLMMRRPYDDEYEGCNKELKCYKPVKDDYGNNQIKEFTLEKGQNYMITFVTKNRFGETDARQIVSRCDLSTNTYNDIGYCKVEQDW